MTVEKIKEVRFMKCATMLRKQYGAKISHVYCEVDDAKDGSIIMRSKLTNWCSTMNHWLDSETLKSTNWVLKWPTSYYIYDMNYMNLSKATQIQIKNLPKSHTITDAYEVAIQLGSHFIKREHVSMNSAIFGRLDYPSEICFVSSNFTVQIFSSFQNSAVTSRCWKPSPLFGYWRKS